MTVRKYFPAAMIALLFACGQGSSSPEGRPPGAGGGDGPKPAPSSSMPFTTTEIARFQEPWAMTFIPDSAYLLVTQKGGKLVLFRISDRSKIEVNGVPAVDYGGQGGLGDIVIGPNRNADGSLPVYLSWVEAGQGDTRGAVVARADLVIDETGDGAAALKQLTIIWRQTPKVTGEGHYSHRIAVSPDGRHIFISSGDRQKFDPAQDMTSNLGKIIRLNTDGSVPQDNPFADQRGTAAQIWSLGHRNGLGLAFDAKGNLWESEMGPQGGDEVNLIQRGANYGWPRVSNGSHYGGEDIPDHGTGEGFTAPLAWWNPSISPGGMAWYGGRMFPQWHDSLLVGALSGKALIRLKIEGAGLVKADQWPMQRVREVEVGGDGAIWLLEDGMNARLLKLTPAS